MTTMSQARDDLYTLVVEAWGDRGPVDYEDRPQDPGCPIPPQDLVPWIRLRLLHSGGTQPVLTSAIGSRCFRKFGVFFVQVFTPVGSSLQNPEEYATIVIDALEGAQTPNDVTIRDVRPNEVGADGHWYQTNVVADVEYDNVK